MTPGNQASNVNSILTNKVELTPCFRKTASGGNRIFKMIVSSDMLSMCFDSIQRFTFRWRDLDSKPQIMDYKKIAFCTCSRFSKSKARCNN